MHSVVSLILLAAVLQDPATERTKPAPREVDEPQTLSEQLGVTPPLQARGSLDLEYISRWTDGASDNDLVGYGTLAFGEAERHLVTGHVSGRFALDMDRERSLTHPFRSIDDTYGSDLTGRLYTAYADLNPVEDNPARRVLRRARVGRQILHDYPVTLFLDGLSVESVAAEQAWDLTLFAFVGAPNHIFKSSPSGDFSTGAGLEVSPLPGGHVRFDYVHLADDYLGTQSKDDLFGVSVFQRIDSDLRLRGYLNLVGSEARDFGGELTWMLPEHDATVTGRYRALLSDQNRRTIDLDYFTPIQATYFAYDQYELFAHKGIGDQLFVDGGAQLRRLRQESNVGIFNHEFQRYYLVPGVGDWPWEGTTLSATGELWDSGGDRFTAFGGDITHEWGRLTGSVGTSFQLYRYDVLVNQERENVQVTYARLLWRATRYVRVRASFEYEDGNSADYYTLRIRMITDL